LSERSGEPTELEQARREAEYYRRIAEEAGRRHLREAEGLSLMVERAQRAERELQRAHEELEQRVEARTSELAATNARLSRVVDERERAQTALRASEEAFRSFMAHFPGLAYVKEADTTVVFASEGFRTYLGLDPKAMVGKTNAQCFHEPFASQVTRDDLRVLATGRSERISEQYGGRSWLTNKFLIPRCDGAPRLGGLTLDVTEAQRSEEERRRLERQMEQVQRVESLGVLAGGIAHDFNNLLAAILANVSVLQAEPAGSAKMAAYLTDVESAARAAANLCQQLLAYAGRAPFSTELLDLSGLVRDETPLLHLCLSRELDLDLHLGEALPPVRGDAGRLRQVVLNLVVNAAEAVGEGGGRITVTTGALHAGPQRLTAALFGEALAEGTYLFLEVKDDGCGMDPDTQRRIFEPFFTSKFTGRGLGLAVVHGIVRQLGGAIELESAPGRGTCFRVLLPAVEAEKAPAARSQLPRDDWAGGGLVLVVDDEPAVRRAAARLLRRLGFEALEAGSGAQAIELYRRRGGEVRAVLLDLTMPQLDGCETLRLLRRIDPEACVVVASGYAEGEVKARFGEDQPDGFVPKPFDLDALRDQLRAALDRSRKPPGSAAAGREPEAERPPPR
jgi:two-component system cell cycle sensor histidine kinase/response regulator CckA